MRIRCRQKKEKEKTAKVAMAAENASLHAQLKEHRLEVFKVYAEEAGKVAEENSKTVAGLAGAVAGMHEDYSRRMKKAYKATISSRFAPQKPGEPDADGAATFQEEEAIKAEVCLKTESLDGQEAKEAKEKTLEMDRRMKELERELQVNESESLPSCMHTQAQLLKHLCCVGSSCVSKTWLLHRLRQRLPLKRGSRFSPRVAKWLPASLLLRCSIPCN